mmetsp:Transcript_49250/g.105311  ORF Transcript_49250/g.105311 Transcript_49250/m.105311 type:complete len:462 (-) Transcript_49250:66-1451(-)
MVRVNLLLAIAIGGSALERHGPALRAIRPRSTIQGTKAANPTSNHSNHGWMKYHHPVREGWDEAIDSLLKKARSAHPGNKLDDLWLMALKRQIDKKQFVATGSTDVGMFDSGIGGLSVYKEFKEQFPNIKVVFLGDLEEPGYSKISSTRVAELSRDIVAWLQKARGVGLTLVTCNLASNAMLKHEILTDEDTFHDQPIIPITAPYGEFFSARSHRHPDKKAVGIFASDSICLAGSIQNSIRSAAGFHIVANSIEFEGQARTVDCIGCRECHMVVDRMHPWENGPDAPGVEVMLRKKFRSYFDSDNNPLIDYLVFGCTHFPMLARTLNRIFGNKVMLVDPAVYQVKFATLFLRRPLNAHSHQVDQAGRDEFYAGVGAGEGDAYERFKIVVEDTLASNTLSTSLPIVKASCPDRMGRAGVCSLATAMIDNECRGRTVGISDKDKERLLSLSMQRTGEGFCNRV